MARRKKNDTQTTLPLDEQLHDESATAVLDADERVDAVEIDLNPLEGEAEVTTEDEAADAPRSPWLGRAARAAAIVLSAGLILSVGVGAVAGHRPMVDMARETRKAPVSVRIHWPEMPAEVVKQARSRGITGPITWMDPDSQRELVQIVSELVTDDPFDYDSLRAAQGALMKTGWFSSPVRLVRQPNGLVEVQGTWRTPFGAVRVNNDDRIVTRAGELLSPQYQPDQSHLKLVLGAQLAPPELGTAWLGGDVQAGLALLDYLRAMPGFEQVYGVDVSAYQTNKTLTIVTAWNTRITWGGHPQQFTPGQAPGETKRRRLADVVAKFGRLDAGRAQIDVRTEDGVYIVDDTAVAAGESQLPEQTAAR